MVYEWHLSLPRLNQFFKCITDEVAPPLHPGQHLHWEMPRDEGMGEPYLRFRVETITDFRSTNKGWIRAVRIQAIRMFGGVSTHADEVAIVARLKVNLIKTGGPYWYETDSNFLLPSEKQMR